MNNTFIIIFSINCILLAGCTKPQLDLNYIPGTFDPISSKNETAIDGISEQSEPKIVDLVPFDARAEDENLITLIPMDLRWEKFGGVAPNSNEEMFEEIGDRRWTPIHFAYNQSFIGETERLKLEKLAKYLSRNPQYSLIIEGHCDERGSEEYNRALGEKRAIAVQNYLEKLAIDDQRIKTISYGEDRPLENGHSESIYSKNRRTEFVVGLQSN